MAVLNLNGRGRVVGFTLVELLVVVSIVALLISILLPPLKSAREQAKQAVCLANLSGLAKASMTYSNEDAANVVMPCCTEFGKPSTVAPGQKTVNAEFGWGGKSGRGRYGPQNMNEGPLSVWGPQHKRGAASRPLNRMMYRSINKVLPGDSEGIENDQNLRFSIYRCPSDTGYTARNWDTYWATSTSGFVGSTLSAYDHFGNSYGGSTAFVCATQNGSCVGMVKSATPFLYPLARIRNTSNTVLYREANSLYAYHLKSPEDESNPCNYDEAPNAIVKGWHGRNWRFTACFTDGHARVIRMPGKQPECSLDFSPLGGNNTDPQENWGCVRMRGDGWQLDTLPSPPISIGLTVSDMGP